MKFENPCLTQVVWHRARHNITRPTEQDDVRSKVLRSAPYLIIVDWCNKGSQILYLIFVDCCNKRSQILYLIFVDCCKWIGPLYLIFCCRRPSSHVSIRLIIFARQLWNVRNQCPFASKWNVQQIRTNVNILSNDKKVIMSSNSKNETKKKKNILKYFVIIVIWFQIMSWEGLCNFCFDLSKSECWSLIFAGSWSRSRSSTAADLRPQVRPFSRWPCRWTGQLGSTQIFYQDLDKYLLFKSLFVIIKPFAAPSTTLRPRRGPCSM